MLKAGEFGLKNLFTHTDGVYHEFWCKLKAAPYFDLGNSDMLAVVRDILKSDVEKAVANNSFNASGLKTFYTKYLDKVWFSPETRLYDPKQWSSSISDEMLTGSYRTSINGLLVSFIIYTKIIDLEIKNDNW